MPFSGKTIRNYINIPFEDRLNVRARKYVGKKIVSNKELALTLNDWKNLNQIMKNKKYDYKY